MVYAAGGDFTYLQWGIGSIIARIIVGIFFVKFFTNARFTVLTITWATDSEWEPNAWPPSSFKLVESSDKAFGFWSRLWHSRSSLHGFQRMHLVHWILCGVLDSDGRNADSHLDGCHAILSFCGCRSFQFVLDCLSDWTVDGLR